MTTMYDLAREEYAALGIDTEAVMEKLAAKPISVHCWQGDDVLGFDQEGGLSGGIQTTGNYPGRARTFEELTCDFEAAMALVPGAKRINLHASYAVFTDENPWVDRDVHGVQALRAVGRVGARARLRHRFQSHYLWPSHDEQRVVAVLAR